MNFTGIPSAPSTSSSSSSSSTHGRKYDLFLSFRGADTRYEFGDTLFTALKRQGIIVFRDNEGLKKGEEINPALEVAIKKSRNAVIIVSQDFTKSKACLFEPTVIMECWRMGRLSVFPVFYHIDPSDVGKLTKDFKNYFNTLEDDPEGREAKWEYWKSLLDKIADRSMDEDLVESSGSALKKLSDISAWVIREDSYINPIIDEICQAIWTRTINDLPSSTGTLVGIKSRAAKVMQLLQLEKKGEVRVVGICGMGGIGKTTLAKFIYDRLRFYFDAGHCSNPIGKRKDVEHLVSIQNKLLYDVFPERAANLSNNAFKVEKVLQSKLWETRVLIVLDDLWYTVQVNQLIGSLNWFGPGSRIIITSRICDLLHLYKNNNIYYVEKLYMGDALKLFCMTAFKQDQPKKGFEELSKKVVDHAKGHPFALNIFGSYLSNKETKAWWDGYLKELGTKLEDNIADTLQKSLEELDKGIISLGQVSPLKELFLDIACFFNRHSKNDVLYILEGVEGFGDNLAHNLSVLKEKSLLTISYGQTLLMHDFLVDLGRQIAKSSRLLQQKDIVCVLESPSIENFQVKGIVLKLSSKERRTFHLSALSKMPNLRVLQISYNHDFDIYDGEMGKFDGDLDHDFEMGKFDEDLDHDDEMEEFDEDLDEDDEVEDRMQWHRDFTRIKWIGDFSKFKLSVDLRIMIWKYYPLESLPRGSNFVPTKLVKLTLSGSCIKRLWDGKKSLPKLRYINLKGCLELIEIPDMSRVPNLESLGLGGCGRLTTVHSSVGCLKRLKKLHLESCCSLEQFPDMICSEYLEVLNFSFCQRLEIPQLISVKSLDLSGNKFRKVPDIVGELFTLWILCLNSSTSLQELSKLPLSLVSLELRDCPSLEVFDSQMTELISKEMLQASGCSFTVAYIGFEGKPYKILYLHPKSSAGYSGHYFDISAAACGPTLEPKITDWFIYRSNSSGKEIQIPMDWNSKFEPGMCALMIVYEVYGHDKRESQKRKLDELENSDIGAREDNNSICPEFVCQLQFNEACPKYTFMVCVPEAACVGSHGLWMCIKKPLSGWMSINDPDFSQELEYVERASCLVSITTSNKNVLLKEGGTRLLNWDARSELVEVVTTISPRGLDLSSLDDSLFDLIVKGPVKPHGPCVNSLATRIQLQGEEEKTEKKEKTKANKEEMQIKGVVQNVQMRSEVSAEEIKETQTENLKKVSQALVCLTGFVLLILYTIWCGRGWKLAPELGKR